MCSPPPWIVVRYILTLLTGFRDTFIFPYNWGNRGLGVVSSMPTYTRNWQNQG